MHLSTAQIVSQRQSLVVTAQLQQAIQLLQYGNQDLTSFIEEQAEQNPFIEVRLPAQKPIPTAPSPRTRWVSSHRSRWRWPWRWKTRG